MFQRGCSWLFGAAVVALAGGAFAQAPSAPPDQSAQLETATLDQARPPKKRAVYDLDTCLRLALSHYPKILESKARLRQKKGQLSQAKAAPFSQFNATGGLAPAPTVRGTNVYSPNSDVSLSSDMGLAWQIGVDGVVPLWTFGKLSGLIRAAEAQVKLGEHELRRDKNALFSQVRTAYYGIQLARDTLALIDDAMRRIDRYLPQLEKRVQEGDGDEIDLLKMKMNRSDLDVRWAEAKREERKALAGLKVLTQVEGAFDIADLPLSQVSHRLAPLSRYLKAALMFRPELDMARAGVAARQAQYELEQARLYPDLGLGLSARWARAPQITDQQNPFVRDEINRGGYGAAIVFRWSLDFAGQNARIDEALAKLDEVEATRDFALGGVAVEVQNAFHDAEAAQARVEAGAQALKYSKQWLVKVQQAIDIGTMDDEDIIDPAKEYALRRFGHLSAIFDYNTAVARLAVASGWQSMLGPEHD